MTIWTALRHWPRLLRNAHRGLGLLIFLSLFFFPVFCQVALSHRPIWQSSAAASAGEPFFAPVIWPWAVNVWMFVMAPAVAFYASTVAPDDPQHRLLGGFLGGFLGVLAIFGAALVPTWWLWRLGVALQVSDLLKATLAPLAAGIVSGGLSARWPGISAMAGGLVAGLLCCYGLC